jgi:hypothetical protein
MSIESDALEIAQDIFSPEELEEILRVEGLGEVDISLDEILAEDYEDAELDWAN